MEYYRCTKNEYPEFQDHWKVGRIYEFDGDRLTTDASHQEAWFTTVMPPVELNPNKIHFEKVTPKTRIIACISSSIPGNYEFVKGRIYEYNVDEEKLYCESKNNERDFFLVTNDQTLSDLLNLLSQGYELKDVTDPNGIYFKCIRSSNTALWKPNSIYEYINERLSTEDCNSNGVSCNIDIILNNYMVGFEFEKVELFNDTTSTQQTKETSVTNMLIEYFENMVEREKRRLEDEAEQYKNDYHTYKRYMTDYYNKWQSIKALLDSKKDTTEIANKITKEIAMIQEHKLYDSMRLFDGCLIIETKHLYITEPYTGRRYSLGKMSFQIPLLNCRNVTIYNNTKTRDGYGTDMHHPHIFSSGEPCWGNTEPMVADYIATKEYYALFVTMLNFCQTVDIDDCAGWYVSCWDEVDEDNYIIRDGHRPAPDEYDGYGCGEDSYDYYCEVCDMGLEEDEMIYCESCSGYFCENHASYYDELGYSLCNTCRDEHYYSCVDCGRLMHEDHVDYYTEGGEPICQNCYEDNYFTCEDCEDVIDINNMSEIDGVCKDCYVFRQEEESEVE